MRHVVDLPIVIDRTAGDGLSVQLAGQLRSAMRDGRIKAGERLPSSRALASMTNVSRTVVTEAYQQLYAEGWLEGRHGSGTFVADIAPAPVHPRAVVDGPSAGPERPAAEEGDRERSAIDLRPGVPWVNGVDTPAWRRAWRLAAAAPLGERPDPRGLPGLRAELLDYLRRGRSVTCDFDEVLVTRGATNGLDMLAATFLRPGDRAGVEDPGYPGARSVLAARGAEVVPCPVDQNGLIVDALPGDLRLLYTTPSHQYPLGGRLSVPRRQALVAWARRTGATIAEDDYDGEFRYDVAPLPALYGLDPDVTVYLGTATKILTPDVGVGWLVARRDLVARVAERRDDLNDRTAIVPQEAVRIMLRRGDLDRHIRRMRAQYARRRAAVRAELGGLPLHGDTAGIHVLIELPRDVTDRVVGEASRHGVLLESTDRYYMGASDTHITGLVIGYGTETLARVRTGCSLVRRLVSASAPTPRDGGPAGVPGPH